MQQKLTQVHIQQIFKPKNKRSQSSQPEYLGKDGTRQKLKSNEEEKDEIKQLYFNAKDKEQLESIKRALKGEQDVYSSNTYKNSSNTNADTYQD